MWTASCRPRNNQIYETYQKNNNKLNIIETFVKNKFGTIKNFDKINYNEKIEINLSKIEPCIAGLKRPQDKVNLSEVKKKFLLNH